MDLAKQIEIAAKYISEGKIVAFPTETVYGLGANALNALAVAKIFEAKERPSFDPLIVHIADISELKKLTTAYDDERVHALAAKFWPGPLTLVLPKSTLIPDIVTSGLPTVGIRMPANDIARELIKRSGCAIAAPSANKFGRISPTSASHVQKQLPGIDYIIDGGNTTVGIESTIIKLTAKGFQILRNGIIAKEDIEMIVPFDESAIIADNDILAPGMIESHYSPNKKMIIADKTTLQQIDTTKAGLISFTGAYEKDFKKIIRVSEHGDLKEYAANLFNAMHTLEDDKEIELIIAEPVIASGVGKAIMDKLRKASFNWNK